MATEQQLFIPNKIKVGYQKREDTYTKKLAYVVYFDAKGVSKEVREQMELAEIMKGLTA